jgi:AAA domain
MALDPRKSLVLIKGEDKTGDVEHIAPDGARTAITFSSGHTYRYSRQNVQVFTNPEALAVGNCHLILNGELLTQVASAYRFEKWVKVFLCNGQTKCGSYSSLAVRQMKVSGGKSTDILGYFRKLAEGNPLKMDDGESLLFQKYQILDSVSNRSILFSFLNPKSKVFKETREKENGFLVFPFGCNLSQKKAVQDAMLHPVSLIKGPPGTGKTQTILNLIANLILQGKKVAVVSSNNSATANVIDKMKSFDLGFLCASLGSKENKNNFIHSQDESEIQMERLNQENVEKFGQEIPKLNQDLDTAFQNKNELALVIQELNGIRLEWEHYDKFHSENGRQRFNTSDSKFLPNMASQRLLQFWMVADPEYQKRIQRLRIGKPGFWGKVWLILRFGLKGRHGFAQLIHIFHPATRLIVQLND